MSNHTKTPWKLDTRSAVPGEENGWFTITQGIKEVACCRYGIAGLREAQANAAFIVRACNNFDGLIKALEDACNLIHYEYCSHEGPHGADNAGCYAQDQHAALADAKGA